MSRAHLLIICFIMSLSAISQTSEAQPRESLAGTIAAKKWQRRVLLIYARDAGNADLLAQKQLLANQHEELNERDFDQIVVLVSDLSATDRNYLRSGDRKLPPTTLFIMYLIGKDGGVKQRFTRPVAATELFRIVDSMPMRQSEMRRQR
ncbi:MAG TPA: DUF4174 domain-containing protein [Fibrella sp.]